MCHGTFDIVHPGHLRHLMYAKEKADLLIASVTADVHIMKANHRPYVPQELRAANLAALEMVDFVIVDPNPTPIEQMAVLQPDFFAKGYEYFANGVPPKTQEELDTLAAYGGEMVFTPGDIVYSSSALIESSPPNLGIEKLLALMDSEGIGFDDLRRTLHGLTGLKVHVVGDTIVDTYSYCSLLGATAKSPTFSVKLRPQRAVRWRRGGGRSPHEDGRRGRDVHHRARQRRAAPVRRWTIWTRPACTSTPTSTRPARRPTRSGSSPTATRCSRLTGWTTGASGRARWRRSRARSARRRAIWWSSATSATASSIARPSASCKAAIPEGALKAADSQVSNRWGNILDFVGFDLITPNEREARFALGDQDSVVRPLALELFMRAESRFLILKLGERGLISYRTPGPQPREFFTIDNFVEHLEDPIGAGDALLSYASMAIARTNNIVIASILGAIGAAVVCERQGNTPVYPARGGREDLDAGASRRVHARLRLPLRPRPPPAECRGLGVREGVQSDAISRRRAREHRSAAAGAPGRALRRHGRSVQRGSRVPLRPGCARSTAFDAAVLAIPDDDKVDLVTYLLEHGKHVLVEKPLPLPDEATARRLEALARAQRPGPLHGVQPSLRAAAGERSRSSSTPAPSARSTTGGCSTGTAPSSTWPAPGGTTASARSRISAATCSICWRSWAGPRPPAPPLRRRRGGWRAEVFPEMAAWPACADASRRRRRPRDHRAQQTVASCWSDVPLLAQQLRLRVVRRERLDPLSRAAQVGRQRVDRPEARLPEWPARGDAPDRRRPGRHLGA